MKMGGNEKAFPESELYNFERTVRIESFKIQIKGEFLVCITSH